MRTPARQIRAAMTDPALYATSWTWERHAVGLGAFGAAAVWLFAHAFAPTYRRERDQFPGAGREVVQSVEDYRRNGGDCDDDVVMVVGFARDQGLAATASFLGNPPRHVRAHVAGLGFVDRVPGAPRFTVC